jgi:hypothetical protein
MLAGIPCRAANDYYTLAQVVTHGEQLVNKLDGINVLAGVQQVRSIDCCLCSIDVCHETRLAR